MFSLNHYRYKYHNIQSFFQSLMISSTNANVIADRLVENLNHFGQRIPNPLEVLINTAPKVGLDLVLGRVLHAFGDNPVASSGFRDLFKIPSTFISYFMHVEIGSTGINHDIGSVVALAVRIPCKAGVLLMGSYYGVTFKASGRAANYICEPFARYFNIVDRELQIARKTDAKLQDMSYFEFMFHHAKKSWMIEAAVEGVFKTTTSDLIGEHIIKRLGYAKAARNSITKLEENLLSVKFAKNTDIWAKFSKIYESKTGFVTKLGSDVMIFTGDYFAKWIPEMITAAGLMFSTRVIQDAAGQNIREFIDYCNQEELAVIGADSQHSEL